jgi:hypothetical protein
MSDFPIDSFNGSKLSPFRKLVSGRVNQSSEQGAQSEPPSGSSTTRIFNEVAPLRTNKESSSDAAVRIAPLEAAVTNLQSSSANLKQFAIPEVALTNSYASSVSVRDVETAAKLAKDLSSRIVQDDVQAKNAQVSGLSEQNVQRFLG